MLKKVFSAATLLASMLVPAGPAPHVIDSAHSQINFIGEARFISAHGFFDKWEAEVNLDPARIEDSTLKITIDATSINTRVQRRDDHLRSKDFLWVEQHPIITFASKKIAKSGGTGYTVIGDLTLRGITKEMSVPLEMVFYENNRGRFRGTFEINRKEFGINFDSAMNSIEDIVKVQVDINVLDKEAVERARRARQPSN